MGARQPTSRNRPYSAAIRAWAALCGALKSNFQGEHPRNSRESAPARPSPPISRVRQPGGPLFRLAGLCALLCALSGCRFDVHPAEFDLSADVGESVSEILEVKNTGDEPLDLSLVTEGATVTLSTRSATLEAGEVVEIEVSAECTSPGDRRSEIAVTGRNSEGAATVYVPFVVRCYADGDAQFVSIELFQGPPVYEKDFIVGTETEPVPMMRPENGAEAVETWVPSYIDSEKNEWVYPPKTYVWSAENDGFVTAIWGRRMAVAVTVSHADNSPTPELEVAVTQKDGSSVSPTVVLEETEADGAGFSTVKVYEVDRSLVQRGASLLIAIESKSGRYEDRLALFGETVEPIQVTWVPVSVEDFPDPELDAEKLMDGLDWQLPIADRVTSVGETMTYVKEDESHPYRVKLFEILVQMGEHHALHACSYDEIYIGVWNRQAMIDRDGNTGPYGLANQNLWGLGNIALGVDVVSTQSPPRSIDVRRAMMTNAHEVGHLLGLDHTETCGAMGHGEDFPYADGQLGPARSWDFFDRRFVSRDAMAPFPEDKYVDIMACRGAWYVSDYSYQIMTMVRQHEEATRTCDNPRPDSDNLQGVAKSSDSPLVSKSARDENQRTLNSVAIAGRLSADGIASISMARPTVNAPWEPRASGAFTLDVIDSGGSVLHSEPLRVPHAGHGHDEALWSARVPYFEDAATIVLRDSDAGGVRAAADLGGRAAR